MVRRVSTPTKNPDSGSWKEAGHPRVVWTRDGGWMKEMATDADHLVTSILNYYLIRPCEDG